MGASAKVLVMSVAVAVAAGSPDPERSAPVAALELWAAPASSRIGRTEAPGAARSIELRAGRGEFEPFQLVVRAGAGGLAGVTAHASDLTDGAGHRIAARHLALYKEAFVEVPAACASVDPGPGAGVNRPLGPGWYADGLIPFERPDGSPNAAHVPFSVAADRNQPIWVDLFVPRDTPPGIYRGTVTVSASAGLHASVPVSLTVWDFELPLRPSMASFFGVADATRNEPALARILVDHGLNGGSFPAGLTPSGQTSAQVWHHLDGGLCGGTAPSEAVIRAEVSAFDGRPDLLLFYSEDELTMQCGKEDARLNAQVRLFAERVHRTRARFLLTDPPFEALLGHVDIWVPKADRWREEDPAWRAARRGGDTFWWYTTAETYHDPVNAPLARSAPRWALDFAPINYRIGPGFISQSLDVRGTLYWQVAAPRGAGNGSGDPWSNPCWRSGWGQQYAGEALLVYPGAAAGLPAGTYVPSMRLKWIRDGVEDFEYVEMLKHLGRGEQALRAARRVGASFRTWTQDPAALDETRRLLGEELHRLRAGRPGR